VAYQIEAARSRIKRELRRIPGTDRDRIGKSLSVLRDDPCPAGVVQLQPDVYRMRVGEYRVIYKVFDDRKLILIGRVARRSENTYKGLSGLFG